MKLATLCACFGAQTLFVPTQLEQRESDAAEHRRQLDEAAAHAADAKRELEARESEVAELRRRLPGFGVPRYVREVVGAAHKVELGPEA